MGPKLSPPVHFLKGTARETGSVSRWDLLPHKRRRKRRGVRRQPIKWIRLRYEKGGENRRYYIHWEPYWRGENRGGGSSETAVGRAVIDQTDSLMVLILFKAMVEMKASLHRYPAVTLTLGKSLTSDSVTPCSLGFCWPPITSFAAPHSCCATFPKWELTLPLCAGWKCGLKCVNNVSQEQFL